MDIDLLGFEIRHLRHVGLDQNQSWYDLDGFKEATRHPGHFDFAFIDGPNEKQFFQSDADISKRFLPEDGNPFGHRDDSSGIAAIKSVTSHCDVMMVDDVQKSHVLKTVDQMLAEPESYDKYYYVYKPHPATTNGLCICVKRNSPLTLRLPAILELLGVRLERNYLASE
jgi:hypothetical protein